jgi:GNAT superfamily N-acetyltransferase
MATLRRATRSDEQGILALVPRLLNFGPPPWRDRDQMGEADLETISKALRSETDDPVVYVAELHGALAGFMHLHSVADYYRRRSHGHVADIVVAPQAEGHGVATLMLSEAESWAKAQGFDWLSISVFERNRRAVGLYEHLGFGRDILRLVKPLK